MFADKRFLLRLVVASALCILSDTTFAGLDTVRGSERHLWSTDRYSVIVAEVKAVSEIRPGDGNGTHRAELRPVALLAGSLDPSVNADLKVTLYADGMTSSIASPPNAGTMVIAVVQGTRFVVSDICTFMPDQTEIIDVGGTKIRQTSKGSALVEIKGLGDPRVLETLKRIQEARAHPDPDPNIALKTPPTTRPATRRSGGKR